MRQDALSFEVQPRSRQHLPVGSRADAAYSVVVSGPALMTVWSKALPLAASCLSSLPGFEFWPGHVRKVSVTLGEAVVFRRVLQFPPPVSTG